METYGTSSFYSPRENRKPTGSRNRNTNIYPCSELFEAVMPLHQIIRFANQAARRRDIVFITIEEELGPKKYQRSVLKGFFRSPVNKNRQIAFEPCGKNLLFLLQAEQILSIQLALSS